MADEKCPWGNVWDKMVDRKWPPENGRRNGRQTTAVGKRTTKWPAENGRQRAPDERRPKKMGENKKADANKLGEDRGKWQGT